MKNRLGYSFTLLFLIIISFSLFGAPDQKDSTKANNYKNSQEIIKEKSTSDTKGSIEVKNSSDKKMDKEYTFYELIFLILIFFCGILLGAFLIYRYSKLSIYSIYKNSHINDKNIYLFDYINIITDLKIKKGEEFETLTSKINDLNKELKSLKDENFDLKNKLDYNADKLKIEEENTKNNVIEWKVELQSKPIINKIYYTIPENDGSFKFTNGKDIKESDCFYKIEIEEKEQKGKLYFISGDYDLRALENIDYYLSPVCEIQNIKDRTSAKKISMINTGSIIKSSDSWKIDVYNKVKIELI